jgi:MFS family permease
MAITTAHSVPHAVHEVIELREQANFRHLVYDIVWFGLAFTATSRFISVFAIRLGATPTEIGLMNALPALILLFSAMLSGGWMNRFNSSAKAIRLPTLLFRFVFLLPMFAPFFPLALQPVWLILAMTIPAIPQGMSNVIFIVMFREAVSAARMPKLLSVRALWFSITLGVSALAYGFWLERAPFPLNYQSMYLFAFFCAMMSFRHCISVRVPKRHNAAQTKDAAPKPGLLDAWKSRSFRPVLLVALLIHITNTMLIAVIPLYLVQQRGAGEGFIALFGLIELASGAFISFFTARLIRRVGNRGLISLMIGLTAAGAVVIALASSLPVTLIGAALAGGGWMGAAMVGLFGYYSERLPAGVDATPYSTAYQQIIGLGTFIGPMLGTLLVILGLNLVTVLLIGGALRLLTALVVEFPFNRLVARRPTSQAVEVSSLP